MATNPSVRDFLTAMRARLSPDEVGLPAYGGTRRVPGLRREELAMLAGMSVDYYNRIERGNIAGVSEDVLTALARALRLDEAETQYLTDLARAAQPSSSRTMPRTERSVGRSIQLIVDGMRETPAYVRNARLDILAMNDLARAIYHPTDENRYLGEHNIARYVFCDPSAEQLPAWDRLADDIVAILRHEAGRNSHDIALHDLIGELVDQSGTFAHLWSEQRVRFHQSGSKPFHHPAVGQFDLWFQAMQIVGRPDLTMLVYTAEPQSASADALALLTSWIATRNRSERSSLHDS